MTNANFKTITPKITVIIPVYNAEKYIEKSLNSVLSQTFADFECILIDDGSPDNSGKICDEYAEKDGRIKVIHQKNAGPAEARHTGIDIAKADFIYFIDSDDWIEPHTLELFYKKQQETDADIVMEKGKTFLYNNRREIKLIQDIKTIAAIPPLAYLFVYHHKGLCDNLYKKNLFQNLYYPPKSPAEDYITNTQIFSKVNFSGLAQIAEVVYNYNLYDLKEHVSYVDDSTAYNKPYNLLPFYNVLSWIEEFLKKSKIVDDKSIWSAFNYLVLVRNIFPYFTRSKFVTNSEAKMLYKKYYKDCSNKKNIPFYVRILIILFVISPFCGKYWHIFCYIILRRIKHLIAGILPRRNIWLFREYGNHA